MSGAAARDEDEEPEPGRPLLLGLVGAGIGGSLSKPMHEREGAACGLSLAYRPIDAEVLGFGASDLPDVLAWATRLGYDGLNVTHPFKEAVVPHLDERSEAVAALGAANTVVIRDGRTAGYNTDWSGFARSLQRSLPDPTGDRVVLVGAGGAGVAVGYALLHLGVGHVAVHDVDPSRAAGCVDRLSRAFDPARLSVVDDLAASLAAADGLAHATPRACSVIPAFRCHRSWCALICGSPTSSTSRSTPSSCSSRGAAAAASYPAVGWPSSRPPGPSSSSPGGRPTPTGCSSTSPRSPSPTPRDGAERVRTGIATVSLSGLLADKLEAIAAAGFDGIEVFDQDLVASPLSPREVALRCADLGLSVDLFQPVRDVEGVAPEAFGDVLHRVRRKLDVAAELGAPTVLLCSNVQPDARRRRGASAPGSCTPSATSRPIVASASPSRRSPGVVT